MFEGGKTVVSYEGRCVRIAQTEDNEVRLTLLAMSHCADVDVNAQKQRRLCPRTRQSLDKKLRIIGRCGITDVRVFRWESLWIIGVLGTYDRMRMAEGDASWPMRTLSDYTLHYMKALSMLLEASKRHEQHMRPGKRLCQNTRLYRPNRPCKRLCEKTRLFMPENLSMADLT